MTNEQSQPWFLYIIENRLGQLYTGITTNVERRFDEHQNNPKKGAKALRGKGPLTLLFSTEFASRQGAMQAEIWVKKQSAATKRLIISGALAMPEEFTSVSSS